MATKSIENVVLGGGISGLAVAFYMKTLLQQSGKVVVLEANSRLGGWIHSNHTQHGSVHELGTRSIRPAGLVGKNTLDMLHRLQLEDHIIPVTSAHPATRNRFIYAKHGIHKLPSSISSLFQRREPFSKSLASYLVREPFRRRSKMEDESIKDFFERRFGPEIATYLVDAFCRGIYAGNSSELSIKSCFPSLFESDKKYGSVILGGMLSRPEVDSSIGASPLAQRARKERWSSWSLQTGLQTLPDRLGSYLQKEGVEIREETPCTRIEFENKTKVHTKDEVIETDRIMCSLPAKSLAKILPPAHLHLAKLLTEIPSVSVAVINLEFEGSVLPLEGFGYLVPSSEPCQVLGVVFDSCTFPEHNRPGTETTRLTCMMGGAWFEELFGQPESVDGDHLLSIALATLQDHLKIKQKPIYSLVSIHRDCIPQYTVGHSRRLEQIYNYITEHHLPLFLLGASYEGVSVNDCIYNARKAVLTLESYRFDILAVNAYQYLRS